MSDITACGTPIEFCGHQDGEIAVAVATSDSINSPFHDGLVLITTALGSLANASDMADPANGENLCYVAALPVTQAIEFAGRVLGALSSAIDSGGGRAAIRQRLLAEIVPEALRAELRDALTAAIDAPRLAARLNPEVVASDAGVELLRTAHDEWAAVEYPADHATAHADVTLTWHAGPDAERSARTDYANARGKALCVTGCEVSEDEIADAGGVPMCLACCAKAEEAFKAQRFACSHSECVRNCASHEPCGWTGTGADLIAAGNLDSDGGAFHECPKCNANSVEEVTP